MSGGPGELLAAGLTLNLAVKDQLLALHVLLVLLSVELVSEMVERGWHGVFGDREGLLDMVLDAIR